MKSLSDYAVQTYRNTEPSAWWKMLNDECRKLGIAERTFGDAYDAYQMGESPETAAANFKAMEE
jgi:hypothetical protein